MGIQVFLKDEIRKSKEFSQKERKDIVWNYIGDIQLWPSDGRLCFWSFYNRSPLFFSVSNILVPFVDYYQFEQVFDRVIPSGLYNLPEIRATGVVEEENGRFRLTIKSRYLSSLKKLYGIIMAGEIKPSKTWN